MIKFLALTTVLIIFLSLPSFLQAGERKRVIINEVAWAGTEASPSDEWIELKNNTEQEISVQGWQLVTESEKITISLSGTIPPKGFFLLERTDDTAVSDIPCNMSYEGGLVNSGDVLRLVNSEGAIEDTANQEGGFWPAGKASPDYVSMERIDPLGEDAPSNWKDNNCQVVCGVDAEGNPINGTPASENSVFFPGKMNVKCGGLTSSLAT